MSMLTLHGTVQNVFRTDASVNKKTGEAIPAADRVQLMAENTLPNGETRVELVTLKLDAHADVYRRLKGRRVSVPVGVFAVGTGVQFYALKGQNPPEEEG
jgi:hypothetical protein